MIVKPSDIAPKDRYKLQIGSVLPRLDRLGEFDRSGRKLEPGSLLILYGGRPVAPMTLIFCPQVPGNAGAKKDILRNIESVSEFVVNITNEETAEKMNLTATALP